jgi:hypothetical protein
MLITAHPQHILYCTFFRTYDDALVMAPHHHVRHCTLPYLSWRTREADPKGWSTVLITALGSWGKSVPRGHTTELVRNLLHSTVLMMALQEQYSSVFYCTVPYP